VLLLGVAKAVQCSDLSACSACLLKVDGKCVVVDASKCDRSSRHDLVVIGAVIRQSSAVGRCQQQMQRMLLQYR
jgi:hypothetical protein